MGHGELNRKRRASHSTGEVRRIACCSPADDFGSLVVVVEKLGGPKLEVEVWAIWNESGRAERLRCVSVILRRYVRSDVPSFVGALAFILQHCDPHRRPFLLLSAAPDLVVGPSISIRWRSVPRSSRRREISKALATTSSLFSFRSRSWTSGRSRGGGGRV